MAALLTACAVHESLDVAELLIGSRQSSLDRSFIGHVAGNRKDFDAILLSELLCARLEALDTTGKKNEIGALLSEAFSHLLAKARRSAGYRNNLTSVIKHLSSFVDAMIPVRVSLLDLGL